MQVNLHNTQGNQFTRYSEGRVTINDTEYNQNILVTPTLITPIALQSIDEFDLIALENILTHKPDIIIFGTGQTIKYPDLKVLAQLQKLRVGFEVMPIPALCRTFNYLIGEGRQVLGLLLF